MARPGCRNMIGRAPSHGTRDAEVVAGDLARIELTPDDLERLDLFWTSRWRRRHNQEADMRRTDPG
jgi:hypothetical protein